MPVLSIHTHGCIGLMMNLKKEVDSKRREISSDNLSMSIGEVLNLYKDGELDIHPEFQRVFRWNGQQKSRLVESLLLGIPLPPIYVAVNEHGIWEVIDGVQRLSTIFEFMGDLKGPLSENDDSIQEKPAFILEGTKHLPLLQGIKYIDLDQTLKLEFKRTRLDIKILQREKGGDSTGKFDLFERLNTYGAVLSPQEIRNCVLVSINPALYRWLKELAENENFISCTLLSDMQRSERYDMDLALRFITLRAVEPAQIGDVHDFLRDRMEQIATDEAFDKEGEAILFKEVFSYLDRTVGGDAFRPWSQARGFRGAFSLGAFEGLGLALGRHWDQIKKISPSFNLLAVIENLWGTEEYRRSFSGMRARERMARVMPAAERIIVAAIDKAKTARRSKVIKKDAPKNSAAVNKVATERVLRNKVPVRKAPSVSTDSQRVGAAKKKVRARLG